MLRNKVAIAPRFLPLGRRLLSIVTIVATAASSLVALAPAVSNAAGGPAPTAVSLSLSTAAAGATEVSYTVQFTLPPSGALVANKGVISLTAPKGTFDGSCSVCLTLADLTTKASVFVEGWRTTANSDGSALSFTTPMDLGAGDTVRAVLPGLNNVAAPGLHDFTIGTSAGGTTTDRFQTVLASPVSNLSGVDWASRDGPAWLMRTLVRDLLSAQSR